MTKSLALENTGKQSRYELLQHAEKRIKDAWNSSIDSMWIIGGELIHIEQESLFEATGKDFKEYVEFNIGISFDTAKRMMRTYPVLSLLKEHNLQLPSNEGQMIELAKLEPDKVVPLWEKIVNWGTEGKHVLTYEIVRDAVTAQRQKDNQVRTRVREKKAKAKGIEIDLGDNGQTQVAQFSEEGEKALNRIRRLCGDAYADAILAKNPEVPENDLIRWSEEEALMVKNLAYWIVIKRWSLKKARNYEERTIDGETTVDQLSDLARSRGGRAYAEWQDVRITIEIVQ